MLPQSTDNSNHLPKAMLLILRACLFDFLWILYVQNDMKGNVTGII